MPAAAAPLESYCTALEAVTTPMSILRGTSYMYETKPLKLRYRLVPSRSSVLLITVLTGN